MVWISRLGRKSFSILAAKKNPGDDYRQMSNEAFTLTLRLVQKIGQVNLTHAIIERLRYLFR